ncbi:MAG: hypothetical protein KJP06_08525, partial [Deltaproteobacteria bacterium]|nr:hypothetical protein [Deltaproteobacteria bacterium]
MRDDRCERITICYLLIDDVRTHLKNATNPPQADRRPMVYLKRYKKVIFRPEQNPEFESLHCIAELVQDISAVLPYLNTHLGGFE